MSVHLSPLIHQSTVTLLDCHPHCHWPTLPDSSLVEWSSEKTEEARIQRTGNKTVRGKQGEEYNDNMFYFKCKTQVIYSSYVQPCYLKPYPDVFRQYKKTISRSDT